MKRVLIKRLFFSTLAAIVLGLIVGIALLAFSSKPTKCAIRVPRAEIGKVVFADSYTPYDCVHLETVDTEQTRAQGLSGREYLAPTQGMLFVFDRPEKACMWMKDMNFSLDVIWLDENKRIIDIKERIAPETYPQSFCPVQSTKYVIEINAGVAQQARLAVGQRINF